MTTEEFIRSRAAMQWSKKMVYEALGISEMKSRAIFAAMPDIVWVHRNRGVGRRISWDAQKGVCSDKKRASIQRASELSAIKRRQMVTICGQRMSIYDAVEVWAGFIDVTARHITWRLRQGQSDYEACFAPKKKSAIGQKKGDWHNREFQVNNGEDNGQVRKASALLRK